MLTQAPPVVPSSTAAAPLEEEPDRASDAASDDLDDESYASSSETLSEDISCQLGSPAGAAPRKLGSIASTYWRPERQDRKENLSVIDERYPLLHVSPLLTPPLLVPPLHVYPLHVYFLRVYLLLVSPAHICPH